MTTQMRFGQSLINGMFNSRSRISVNDASLTISQESRLDHRQTPTPANDMSISSLALSQLAKFNQIAFGISKKTQNIKDCLKKVQGFKKQSRNTEVLRKNACKNIDILKQEVITSRTSSSNKLKAQFESLKSDYDKKQQELKRLETQMQSLQIIGMKYETNIKQMAQENVRLQSQLVMESMIAEVQKNIQIQTFIKKNTTLNYQIQFLNGEITKSRQEQQSLLDKTRTLEEKLRISESSQLRSRSGSMLASFDGFPLGPSQHEASDIVNNFIFYIENTKNKIKELSSFFKPQDYSRQSISKKQDISAKNLQSNLQIYTKIVQLTRKLLVNKLNSHSVLIDISNHPVLPPPTITHQINQFSHKQYKVFEIENKNLKEVIQALKAQLMNKYQESNMVILNTQQQQKERDYEKKYKKIKIAYQQLTSQLKELQIKEKRLLFELDRQIKQKRKLHNIIEDMKGKIRVYCRIKPYNQKSAVKLSYKTNSSTDIIYLQSKKKQYKFDAIYGESTTQQQIFQDTRRLVKSAVDGDNVCIFAYGQTGSGKTYTLIGDSDRPGISFRSIEQMFLIKKQKKQFMNIDISMSLFEIYLDKIYDLFGEKKQIRNTIIEHQKINYVQNGTFIKAHSVQQVISDYRKSLRDRQTSSTFLNHTSSRSHLVLTFLIETFNNVTCQKKISKFNIVDLAGSESLIKSRSQLQTQESKYINSSLSALRCVFNGINNKDQYIKYQDNKLTHLLKDSLGGKSKTLIFVNLLSQDNQVTQTISTLQFASAVKKSEKNTYQKSSFEGPRRSMSTFGYKTGH